MYIYLLLLSFSFCLALQRDEQVGPHHTRFALQSGYRLQNGIYYFVAFLFQWP